ncbi:MAG TPA: DUF2834 domain-containing protein [Parvularculaceae bacterium]|nr:DUF2834 domain-containing protein [Parvularculaceae bacterium]
MTRAKLLRGFFGLVALVALIGTWSQNLHYFEEGAGPGAFARFIVDLKANPATRSISIDIGLFFLAAAAFMVIEARRLNIRFVWLYILGGLLIAISVTFPLFLAARQAKIGETAAGAKLNVIDAAAFAALTALVVGLAFYVAAP